MDTFSPETLKEGHIAFLTVGIRCLIIVSAMFATLVEALQLSSLRNLSLIRFLLLCVYICTTCFLVSAGVRVAAFDFTTGHLCKSAIKACLTSFFLEKIIFYLFVVERIRQLRGNIWRRDLCFRSSSHPIETSLRLARHVSRAICSHDMSDDLLSVQKEKC